MDVPDRLPTTPRSIGSLRPDCRGSSAVEFALIAPVLILMIGGIFSIGMILRAHTAISTYAREAARGIAVGYMTDDEAKRFAETHSASELKVVVTAAINRIAQGSKPNRDIAVTLEISQAEMAKMVPFGGFISGGIQAKAVMRSPSE